MLFNKLAFPWEMWFYLSDVGFIKLKQVLKIKAYESLAKSLKKPFFKKNGFFYTKILLTQRD
jgi:hypothetical protein